MGTAVAPQIGLCPDYQRLLLTCQKTLATWQQLRALTERDPFVGLRLSKELQRRKDEYARAYYVLESHEQFCQACQYVSKVGGLDFESMFSALNHYHPLS